MGKLYILSDFRKKYDPTRIYPGDTVEWEDYNGETYQDVVVAVCKNQVQMDFLPMAYKANFAINVREGMQIYGLAIKSKVVKRKAVGA